MHKIPILKNETYNAECMYRVVLGRGATSAPMQDVFALGCVIAEVFLEGQRLFDLSEVRLRHRHPAQLSKLFWYAYVLIFCVLPEYPRMCLKTYIGAAVQLLAYKRGQFDPAIPLAKVEEPFRQLILHMINVNPGMPH